MDHELQVLIARLSARRWLPRADELVRRALTDDAFHAALASRLAACGLELAENPFADHVALRLKRDMEQPVFGREDAWLSNSLGLKSDQIALLVVLWALLILPKRQRQIERQEAPTAASQNEMFALEKALPRAADLRLHVAESTLVADFGGRLGGKTRISIGLGMLSRQGFIERREGRIHEGPLLDLALDYNRMAQRVLDGTLADLFGNTQPPSSAPSPVVDEASEPGDEDEN